MTPPGHRRSATPGVQAALACCLLAAGGARLAAAAVSGAADAGLLVGAPRPALSALCRRVEGLDNPSLTLAPSPRGSTRLDTVVSRVRSSRPVWCTPPTSAPANGSPPSRTRARACAAWVLRRLQVRQRMQGALRGMLRRGSTESRKCSRSTRKTAPLENGPSPVNSCARLSAQLERCRWPSMKCRQKRRGVAPAVSLHGPAMSVCRDCCRANALENGR